jgi:DnaJ-class molecular chaperone
VWENEGDQKFYTVTFARTYLDDANKYHDSDSFGRDDLPLVAKLADQAHTFTFDGFQPNSSFQNIFAKLSIVSHS